MSKKYRNSQQNATASATLAESPSTVSKPTGEPTMEEFFQEKPDVHRASVELLDSALVPSRLWIVAHAAIEIRARNWDMSTERVMKLANELADAILKAQAIELSQDALGNLSKALKVEG